MYHKLRCSIRLVVTLYIDLLVIAGEFFPVPGQVRFRSWMTFIKLWLFYCFWIKPKVLFCTRPYFNVSEQRLVLLGWPRPYSCLDLCIFCLIKHVVVAVICCQTKSNLESRKFVRLKLISIIEIAIDLDKKYIRITSHHNCRHLQAAIEKQKKYQPHRKEGSCVRG